MFAVCIAGCNSSPKVELSELLGFQILHQNQILFSEVAIRLWYYQGFFLCLVMFSL